MACNTCGQSSCECKLGAYACPKLSNPPTCDELRDLKENMMDELQNNREYVSGCNPDSIVRYVDSIMERISCLNDQELNALCYLLNKPELVFNDTNTIDLNKASNIVTGKVKISRDTGNMLQAKDDGLFISVNVQDEDSVQYDIRREHDGSIIKGRATVGLSQGATDVIHIHRPVLEELVLDQERVIATILDTRFAPTSNQSFVGFFTFGSINGSDLIDLAIPFSGEIRTNGQIVIKELSPMVPAYVYKFQHLDGTVSDYPGGASSILRKGSNGNVTCIERADASIANVSWSNSYKGE